MATAIKPDGKSKLLDAALTVIRTKGYNASTVDDICRAAGVSKGSFFTISPIRKRWP
jgi:TetR/AcrR family transcriptional repressor of nem operon